MYKETVAEDRFAAGNHICFGGHSDVERMGMSHLFLYLSIKGLLI